MPRQIRAAVSCHVGALPIPDGPLRDGVVYGNLAFFGVAGNFSAARIVRVDLQTFQRTGTLPLQADEQDILAAALTIRGELSPSRILDALRFPGHAAHRLAS